MTGFGLPARWLSLPEAPRPVDRRPKAFRHPVQRALWGFSTLGGSNAGAVIAATSALGLI
jgi:hypothetical protein